MAWGSAETRSKILILSLILGCVGAAILLGIVIFELPWRAHDAVRDNDNDINGNIEALDLLVELEDAEDILREKWEGNWTSLEKAKMLLDTYPVIDGHNDFPWNMRKLEKNDLDKINFRDLNGVEPWESYNESFTDIRRLREGRVGAQFWVAYTDCPSQSKDSVQLTLEQIDLIQRLTESYPEELKFCTSSKCILQSRREGRIASLIGIEGGQSIASSPAVLRQFYRLGARYLTLTHGCNTPWADASPVDSEDGKVQKVNNGLSQFGLELIDEMNRIGMMVDLSHVSREVMLQALGRSKAPVIFSHSGAKAVCDHHRNVGDDVLQLLKSNDGIIMINFYTSFVNCDDPTGNITTIDDVVKHIEHIRALIGPDHIGLGGDYDGVDSMPQGLEDVSKYPNLFAKLIDLGWEIDDLKKLAFLNLIRVMKQVEVVSTSAKSDPSQRPMHKIIPSSEMERKNISIQCLSPKSLAILKDNTDL